MGRRRPEWAVAGNGQPGRRAPVIARSAASCGRPPLRGSASRRSASSA